MAASLLTNREMELFRCCVNSEAQRLGVSADEAARKLMQTLSFKIDEDDVAEVCEEIGGS
jgi:hypothetical protein